MKRNILTTPLNAVLCGLISLTESDSSDSKPKTNYAPNTKNPEPRKYGTRVPKKPIKVKIKKSAPPRKED